MKAGWNYVTALAALLAVGDLTGMPSLMRDARWRSSAQSAVYSGKESLPGQYRVRWKAHSFNATVAWAQQSPVLPPGSQLAGGGSMLKMRPGLATLPPDPFGDPAQAQPPFPRRGVDPAQLKRTTGQLEDLFKTVQPEITEVSKGRLPKDLIPHLKQIEKLSKQLRREISR